MPAKLGTNLISGKEKAAAPVGRRLDSLCSRSLQLQPELLLDAQTRDRTADYQLLDLLGAFEDVVNLFSPSIWWGECRQKPSSGPVSVHGIPHGNQCSHGLASPSGPKLLAKSELKGLSVP